MGMIIGSLNLSLILTLLIAQVGGDPVNDNHVDEPDLKSILENYIYSNTRDMYEFDVSNTDRKLRSTVDVVFLMDQTPYLVETYYRSRESNRMFDLLTLHRPSLEKYGRAIGYYTNEILMPQDVVNKLYTSHDQPSDYFLMRYAFIPRSKANEYEPFYKSEYTCNTPVIANTFSSIANINYKTEAQKEKEYERIAKEYPYPNWVINIMKNYLLFPNEPWSLKDITNLERNPRYNFPFWDVRNIRIIVIFSEDFLFSKFPVDSIDYYKIQLLEESYSKIASEQHIITIPVFVSKFIGHYGEEKCSNRECKIGYSVNNHVVEYSKVYYPFHKESKPFTAFSRTEIELLNNIDYDVHTYTIDHLPFEQLTEGIPTGYDSENRPFKILGEEPEYVYDIGRSHLFMKDFSFNFHPFLMASLYRAIGDNYFLLSMEAPIVHSHLYEHVGTPQSRLNFTRLPFEQYGQYASDNMLSYQMRTPPNIFTYGDYDILKFQYGEEGEKLRKIAERSTSPKLYEYNQGFPEMFDELEQYIRHTNYLIVPHSKKFSCIGLVYANKFLSHAYSLANYKIELNATKLPLVELIKPFYIEPVMIISMTQATKCGAFISERFAIMNFFSGKEGSKTCPYVFVLMKAVYDGMDDTTGLPKMKIRLEFIQDACTYSDDDAYFYPHESCLFPDPYILPFEIRDKLENMRVINLVDLLCREDNTINIDHSLRTTDSADYSESNHPYSCEISRCTNYFLSLSGYDANGDNKTYKFDRENFLNPQCDNSSVVFIHRRIGDRNVKPYKAANKKEMYFTLSAYVGKTNYAYTNHELVDIHSDLIVPIYPNSTHRRDIGRIMVRERWIDLFRRSMIITRRNSDESYDDVSAKDIRYQGYKGHHFYNIARYNEDDMI